MFLPFFTFLALFYTDFSKGESEYHKKTKERVPERVPEREDLNSKKCCILMNTTFDYSLYFEKQLMYRKVFKQN